MDRVLLDTASTRVSGDDESWRHDQVALGIRGDLVRGGNSDRMRATVAPRLGLQAAAARTDKPE